LNNISITDNLNNVPKENNFLQKKSTILLISFHFAAVLIFAFTRLIDLDEGFYLTAAQEIRKGRTLYIDFFFPQMPYLPFAFSPISGFGFTTLFLARVMGAFASLLATIIFARIICKVTANNSARTLLLFLYSVNALFITWHSTAKPYMFTDLLLLFSFFSLLYYLRVKTQKMIIATAVSLALAVNFRSVFAPLLIFYAIIFILDSPKQRLKTAIIYSFSVIAVSLPTLYLLFLSPDHFIFDNIGFHLMRANQISFGYGIIGRIITIGKFIITPQIFVLLILAIIAFTFGRKNRKRSPVPMRWYQSPVKIAGWIAALITLIYTLPKPTLQQYYLQMIPFFLIAFSKNLENVFINHKGKILGISRAKMMRGLILIYGLGIIPYIIVFIIGVRESDGSHRIDIVRAMCTYISEESGGELILSEWPAIPVLSRVPAIEGMESYGYEVGVPLTEEEKRYYKLPLNSEIDKNIRRQKPKLIVFKNEPVKDIRPTLNELYIHSRSFGGYHVYKRIN